MSYQRHLAEHWRITILRLLGGAPSYTANESILQSGLSHFGLRASRDQVKGELRWLEEQGLVSITEVGRLMVATATQRGLETAQGIVAVPGVQRPSPSD